MGWNWTRVDRNETETKLVRTRRRANGPTRATTMSDGATENDVASQKTTEPQFKTEREVIDYFTTLSQEVNLARGKIGELGVSLREHVNVLQNVKDLDPSRRCFRSVGGVLVERTVKEVIPAVETNAANLQKAIDAIKEQCAVKEAELEALRRKYKIRVQGEEGDGAAAGGSAAKSSGILA